MPILNMIYGATGGGGKWKPGVNTVAYYPLETDALDQSGNSNDGTWVGTAAYTTVGGKAAASFNSSYYINTGVVTGSYPITIACFFYFTSASGYKTIMGSPLGWNGAPDIGLCMLGYKGYGWCGTVPVAEGGGPTLSSNTWHFGCVRIDNSGNIKLQIDDSKFTGTSGSFNITDTIYIGAGVGNRFSGNVRQAAIWDISITDEELESYRQTLM